MNEPVTVEITIGVNFADGDNVYASVEGAPNGYPDALAQLRSEAVHAFNDAIRAVFDVQRDDPT